MLGRLYFIFSRECNLSEPIKLDRKRGISVISTSTFHTFKVIPNLSPTSFSLSNHNTLSLSLSLYISLITKNSSMAQKREKEETELKVPETLTLCTPPITAASAKISASDDRRSSPDRSDLKSGVIVDFRSNSATSPEKPDLNKKRRSEAIEPVEQVEESSDNMSKRRVVNRCSGCKRKVGLTGFRCRCGDMFCSEHRYSDRHDCSYDYKAAGREAIARENPVVRAAKILKV